MCAAARRSLETVKLLVTRYANIYARYNHLSDALSWARHADAWGVEAYLEDLGIRKKP
jgi:hypothetical protein